MTGPSGIRSGVGGAPTLYPNGPRHDDDHSLEALPIALVKAAPAAARQ